MNKNMDFVLYAVNNKPVIYYYFLVWLWLVKTRIS